MALDVAQQERAHRLEMWERLRAAGGPKGVASSVLRELGIYGGQQGIWVDKARTASLTEDRTGVTVGLLHTGSSYADDLTEDGVVYHYPSTQRQGRDAAEVAATKAARTVHLPVFVITYPSPGASTRDVQLGWVQDWEDASRLFLVAFGEEQPPPRPVTGASEEATFALTEARRDTRREVAARMGQARFKFDVLRRYGAQCAVCDLAFLEALDAAHLCPRTEAGSNDARNGLVFCAVHHRAFDAGLFAVDPGTLALRYKPGGPDARILRISRPGLDHLLRHPHLEALDWCWRRWSQRHAARHGEALEQ
jgi:hypothetical protein